MAAETIIQIRRGQAATWTSQNPVLAAGELGLETDTRKVKIGDGTTVWVSLNYSVGQVGNLNMSGNTISAVDENGDITLDPNGTGDVKVASGADLIVAGDVYSATSKKLATEEYVDAVKQGLDVKNSVRAATTANVTLASGLENGDVIDGITLATGDRVLVKNQTTGSENGIYVVKASGAPDRAVDADSNDDVTPGMFTFVEEGTVNSDSGWVLTTNGPVVLGTTSLAFTQFSGAGQVTAGAGLTKNGNTIDVGTADATRIVVNGDSIDLATTGIAAGTYQQVAVDAYGRVTSGTNPTTLAGYGIVDAQGLDATLTALAGLSTNVDQVVYATGVDTFSTSTLTSFGRSLIDDVSSSDARTTLGVVIGTDVQAYDAELAALAGVTSAANALPYFTGSGTASTTTLTSFGRSLVDDASSSDARTTLGLVIGTDVQAYNSTLADVAGGTYTGDDSITTVGTIATGTWQGSTVGAGYGGTGLSSYAVGDLVYANGQTSLAKLAAGTGKYMLRMNSGGTAPEWSNSIDGGTP
jgi:hypothetical protein